MALIAALALGAVATGVGRPLGGPAAVLAQAQAQYQEMRFDAAAASAPPDHSITSPRNAALPSRASATSAHSRRLRTACS